ncbi:MTMR9 [Mytilus coruscus]|uniref:MTMR9 n=1 Tax=Mytilus coruscus TaxID=42192 RepID=A0A6J8E7P6_MYTCO|nr:MTMR9 [Mytilus coruscus]
MEFAEFIKTPTVENVCMKRPFTKSVTGTLCITGHHVILSSRSENHEELWVSYGHPLNLSLVHWHHVILSSRSENHEELWLLHSAIDSTEKKMTQSNGKYILILRCKDLQMIELEFNGGDDCLDVASSIEKLSHVDDISLKYPFFYRAGFEPLEDGWQAFLPENEYTRFKDCSEEWRLSYVNKDYKVCASYPHAVIVPKSIDDETVIKASQFRQNGRFPVLSYYHRQTKAVMMRCSQPLTGMNNKRCKEDERMVNSVMGRGNKGYIIDTRSPSAAKSAQNKGMIKSVMGRDNKGYIIDTRSPSAAKSAQNKGMVKSVMGVTTKVIS